jgi:hypothetical protein
MRKGADIYPHEIITYGIVNNTAQNPTHDHLYIPLIFHNEGIKPGMITKIEILFDNEGEIKPLQILAKVELNDIGQQAARMNIEDFTQKGYTVKIPLYPINVPAGESTDIVLQCYQRIEDNIFLLDKEFMCIIRINYGRNKTREVRFPFLLTSEDYEETRFLKWYRPRAGNLKELYPH